MERRQLFEKLLPEYIRENESFDIFSQTIIHELGIDGDNIELFSGISDVNRMPPEFLEDIADLFGYDYRTEVSADTQREIIKRYLHTIKERGKEESIKQNASYGYSEHYVGKDLTTYDGHIDPLPTEILYPYEMLFTLSSHKGKLDGTTVMADDYFYNDGVIIIRISTVNDRLRDKVKKQIPAGIKYVFQVYRTMDASFVIDIEPTSFYSVHLMMIARDDALHNIYQLSTKKGYLSGRRQLYAWNALSIFLQASFAAGGYPKVSTHIRRIGQGCLGLSTRKSSIEHFALGGQQKAACMYADWNLVTPDNDTFIVDDVLTDGIDKNAARVPYYALSEMEVIQTK